MPSGHPLLLVSGVPPHTLQQRLKALEEFPDWLHGREICDTKAQIEPETPQARSGPLYRRIFSCTAPSLDLDEYHAAVGGNPHVRSMPSNI
ncbi:hypothetical protein V496_07209 [Pseudogymnoascus sp. VKM F-4515 (FW-2607)]|nr:hypothetical protein V496_07209 [Pseudogymnoascus sp. VKM F-4515 (FW-2607)]